jgi:hypothetical protein
LDRGRQCGHFAPRTLSKSLFIFFRFVTYVVFHIFSVFFDLTGTFQVQPLSGKGWWYVYNFDWYPKCPKWSTLNRNVSIFVRTSIRRSASQTRTLLKANQLPKRQPVNSVKHDIDKRYLHPKGYRITIKTRGTRATNQSGLR